MSPISVRRPALPLALLASAACSSSSAGLTRSSGTEPPPAIFSAYCTGTLNVEVELEAPDPSPVSADAWLGNGTLHAGAGTTFLIASGSSEWTGFAFLSDGTPTMIDTSAAGLVEGTDFSSSCAPAMPSILIQNQVLLADTTAYVNPDMSGKACALPAGLPFGSFSAALNGAPGQVTGGAVMQTCGVSLIYVTAFASGPLTPL